MNRTRKFWSLIVQHLCPGIWKLVGSLQHYPSLGPVLQRIADLALPISFLSQTWNSATATSSMDLDKKNQSIIPSFPPWTLLTLFFGEHDDRVLERIQSQPEGETRCHQSSYDRNIVSITEIYKNCYGKLHLGYYISDIPLLLDLEIRNDLNFARSSIIYAFQLSCPILPIFFRFFQLHHSWLFWPAQYWFLVFIVHCGQKLRLLLYTSTYVTTIYIASMNAFSSLNSVEYNGPVFPAFPATKFYCTFVYTFDHAPMHVSYSVKWEYTLIIIIAEWSLIF